MSCFEAGRSVTIDDYFTSLENFGKIFDIQDAMGEFLVQQRDSLLEIKEKAAAATDTPSEWYSPNGNIILKTIFTAITQEKPLSMI